MEHNHNGVADRAAFARGMAKIFRSGLRCMSGVVVVGAGVAGLAAAAALRRRGITVTVIEGSRRVGGRAYTTVPLLLQAPFDHGAAWLHAAEQNPLAALAQQAGEPTITTAAERVERTRVGRRFATAAELADYAAAEAAFGDRTAAALGGADVSLADAAAPVRDTPWLASVLNWEAPTIAAADARSLSLRDWHANLLHGANLEVPGGLGAFVLRHLLPPAGPVHLGTPALAVHSGEHGVTVQTPAGTIQANACIVTVSTGVLAAEQIGFQPPLPPLVQDAINGLPMGVLNKVALRAAGTDRLDLPASCGLDQFVSAVDAPAMTTVAWPHAQDHVICFHGGSHSAELDRNGGAEAFAREQLRAMFGSRADAAFRPGAVVTRWASDRWFRGSYAYARPGHSAARAVLGTPLFGGKLVFAGEATRTDGLAGTVGGAFLAGTQAAELVAVVARQASPP